MNPTLLLTLIASSIGAAAAQASDCSCINGFDPDVLPEMNVTDFVATAYPNGTSVYSFDLAYWPGVGLARCQATLQGSPGVFVSVWGDQYCSKKADGSFVPIWWYWSQSLPDRGYDLRVESKYIDDAGFCLECLEWGTHTVSSCNFGRSEKLIEYRGSGDFAIIPRTVHR